MRHTTGPSIAALALAVVLALATAAPIRGRAESSPAATPADPIADALRRYYAVHVGSLYGVYLGNGLIITAAHVANGRPHVRMAGLDLPATIIKRSPFEQLDLALLSVDQKQLPISLRLRRMPLCTRPLVVNAPVIVAIPEKVARSKIISPLSLPLATRKRFPTAIRDVATTGDSGSGVFDAQWNCLLGIMSRKIIVRLADGTSKDIAKYFVPAAIIRKFIPAGVRF